MNFRLDEMHRIKSGEITDMKQIIREVRERNRPLHSLKGSLNEGTNIIAELKHSSPSAGTLAGNLDDRAVINGYIAGGASGISVLAEKEYFGGSYQLLRDVCSLCDCPVLCKDFIYFEEQVEAAYLCGADMVLLISRVLEKNLLEKLYMAVKSFGMEPLVEIHERSEIDSIVFLNPDFVLVNMRNLETLEIDFRTGIDALNSLPEPVTAISASGINSKEDMMRIINETGTGNFLIGSSLMRSNDPASAVREFKSVC